MLAAPAPLREVAMLTGAVDDLLPTAQLGALAWREPPPAVAVNLHGRGPQSTVALSALQPCILISYGNHGPVWDGDLHEVRR